MSQSIKGPSLFASLLPFSSAGDSFSRQGPAGARGGAFGSDLPDLDEYVDVRAAAALTAPGATDPPVPVAGVLVIGMGDEQRGDGGIGLHLMLCLQQMDWPGNVTFTRADADVHHRAGLFRRVIVLDALEGPGSPGSLYQADPDDLLAGGVAGTGLLPMLSAAVRRRLSVFGVQPGSTNWGALLSAGVLASVPILLSYLRARILQVAVEHQSVN